MPEFLDTRTILITLHVFGAILGAGGAFASDTIFLNSVRDGVINKVEMRFIRLISKLVWGGLTLIILSGIGLFLLSPEEYMNSSKFLAKMSIVAIIALNGIVFHIFHIPLLGKTVDVPFSSSTEFKKRATGVMISGGISMTSWICAVILGMLRGVPYSYLEILGMYGLLIAGAIASAVVLKNKLLKL